MSLEDMTHVLRHLPTLTNSRVLVGINSMDDAGVYALSKDQALILTIDSLSPIVDDPVTFGRIVAANCLSDVYAMGGAPLHVSLLIGFPEAVFSEAAVAGMIAGAAEKIIEAGATVADRHIMFDKEVKFGMAVCGLADPSRILTNAGARPGDALILTKPLGTATLSMAVKSGKADPSVLDTAVQSMSSLNKYAAEAVRPFDPHAVTDITGFGFLGHAFSLARQSRVSFMFSAADIPYFPYAKEYSDEEYLDIGSRDNRAHLASSVALADGVPEGTARLLFEAQTSGGLLIALPRDRAAEAVAALRNSGVPYAARVGEVTKRKKTAITVNA